MSREGKIRLLCIPPSATSAMMYLPWQSHFDSRELEIVPLELPGKGTKFRQEAPDSIDGITDSLMAEAIRAAEPSDGAAYALFGFCSGSVILFDLYQKMRSRGVREPEHVFISSSRIPDAQIETPSIIGVSDDELLQRFRHFFRFSAGSRPGDSHRIREILQGTKPEAADGDDNTGTDMEFLRSMGQADEEGRKNLEEAKRVMEIFRQDSRILHEYRVPERVVPFGAPMTAIHGKYDAVVSRSEMDRWKKYAGVSWEYRRIRGGHLAVFDDQEGVIEIVKEALGCR